MAPSLRWSCSKAAWCSCLTVTGHRAVGPLSPGSPRPQAGHGGVRAALVHEHQPPRIEAPYPFVPAHSFGLVALRGGEGLFLSGSPRREKARLTLETETARPCSSWK